MPLAAEDNVFGGRVSELAILISPDGQRTDGRTAMDGLSKNEKLCSSVCAA